MEIPKPETRVEVVTEGVTFEGIVLPSDSKLVLKLSSGYNVGINKDSIKSIKELEPLKKPELKTDSIKEDSSLPTIAILHTGGTIASKVDYQTGAVISRSSPEEILASVPELRTFANIKAETVFQMFSEDIEPAHWGILAKRVAEVIKTKPAGIIVAIGTDTLEYVSSALSFALTDCPVPVLVLGSQRSSDRPSSDASMNLICASRFICNTKFKGVAVCMHDKMDDKNCLIIDGQHVKKMHTSRRDTFRPVNVRPIARVNTEGVITYLKKDYKKTTENFEPKCEFSEGIYLVKVHPGFRAGQLDWYEKNAKGLVIEGYAFGQLPINEWDTHTKQNPALLKKVRSIAAKIPVVIVSQRPYGVVFMNVYSTSRDLLNAGVIEGRMQSHVALVKLSFVLANYENPKEAMSKNLSGELVERTEEEGYLF